MAIADELSGEVAVAVLGRAGKEGDRDRAKLKEILINFYSSLRALTVASRGTHVRTNAASASSSHDRTMSREK
jgi:hypothetical protein